MIRIYRIREKLEPVKAELSDAINVGPFSATNAPSGFSPWRGKPGGRMPIRKKLIRLLFTRIHEKLGIERSDVEGAIFESPACNFGFRGRTGDEAALAYKIDV